MAKHLSKFEKSIESIQWKYIYIDGESTHYMVSDLGLVKNLMTNRLLEGSPDKRGYIMMSIYVGDRCHTKSLHRLVANAFIPNPENKPTVNHIDGNKRNNKVSNLEWATHKENIDHAIATGLRNPNGVNAPSNIYSEQTVHNVCKLLESGIGCKDIANRLGVNINLPRRILYGVKWKEISSQYTLPKVNYHNRPKNILKGSEAECPSTIEKTSKDVTE